MAKITFPAKQVKKMENPISTESKDASKKYVCYVNLTDVPCEFKDWMQTNPREQNLKTVVAKAIQKSIDDGKKNFHEINRGIVMSVDKFSYDNKTGNVTVVLTDPEIHGNIDGGHTMRAILDSKKNNKLVFEQYVFFEFFTGISSPVELAEARNQSVQVDTKSIEELNKSFDTLKSALCNESFYDRIAFKQNEHQGEKNIIDAREIIAISNMFNQVLFPDSSKQPVQSYTGKEASLNRFLNIKGRDEVVKNMTPILPDIFRLWDKIETEFADKAKEGGKIYRRKRMANYEEDSETKEPKIVGHSKFGNAEMDYTLPKGIIFPVVGAFRALVTVDPQTKVYGWIINPVDVWDEIGKTLARKVLESSEELSDSPDAVAKSQNTWDLLYKEVLIHSIMKTKK